jgi:hypothetical protein
MSRWRTERAGEPLECSECERSMVVMDGWGVPYCGPCARRFGVRDPHAGDDVGCDAAAASDGPDYDA